MLPHELHNPGFRRYENEQMGRRRGFLIFQMPYLKTKGEDRYTATIVIAAIAELDIGRQQPGDVRSQNA